MGQSHKNFEVLIVDDSAFMVDLIRKALEEYGCEIVGEGQNGYEGIELYKHLRPDFVTLDINMPEVDGIEAIKEIRKIDSSAIIIVISEDSDKKEEVLELGARTFLRKPFQPAFLWRKVDELTGEIISKKETQVINEDYILEDFEFTIETKKCEEVNEEIRNEDIENFEFTIESPQNKAEVVEHEEDFHEEIYEIDSNKNIISQKIIIKKGIKEEDGFYEKEKQDKVKEKKKPIKKENEFNISISPPRGDYEKFKQIKKEPRTRPHEKAEAPILNYVGDEEKIEKEESFIKKIKNLFKFN